jgi:hypothetical protein
MKSHQHLHKLEQMVSRDMAKIESSAIFADGKDYQAFGMYYIRFQDTGYLVEKRQSPVQVFGSLRTAMAWCSADNLGKGALAAQIIALEQQRSTMAADLAVRQYLAKSLRDHVRQENALTKVENRKYHIRYLETQLEKCISLAKYWQIQGFEHETARTRRTETHRANR